MSDFEDTFGEGVDASDIVDGHPRNWSLARIEQDEKDRAGVRAMMADPAYIAEEARRKAEIESRSLNVPPLSSDEQAARRRAIELAIQGNRDREAAARARGQSDD